MAPLPPQLLTVAPLPLPLPAAAGSLLLPALPPAVPAAWTTRATP